MTNNANIITISVAEVSAHTLEQVGSYKGAKKLNGNKAENYFIATLVREQAHGNKIACEVKARYMEHSVACKNATRDANKLIKGKESVDDLSVSDSKNLHNLWKNWAENREYLTNDLTAEKSAWNARTFMTCLESDPEIFPETLKFQNEMKDLYDLYKNDGEKAFCMQAREFFTEKLGEDFAPCMAQYLWTVAGRSRTSLDEKANGQFKAVSQNAFAKNITCGLIEIATASGIVSNKWLKVVCKKADKAAE